MKLRRLAEYMAGLFRRTGAGPWTACLLPVCAGAGVKAAELFMCGMLIYFGGARPEELLTGSPELAAAAVVFTAFRWTVCAPLRLCAAGRALELCRGRAPGDFFRPLMSRGAFSRSVRTEFLCRGISFAAALPAGAFAAAAGYFLSSEGGRTELFIAMHCCVLTAVWAS